jgi:hypothetical protein
VLDSSRQIQGLEMASGALLSLNGYHFTIHGDAAIAGALTNITLASATPGARWRVKVMDYGFVRGAVVSDSDATSGIGLYPMNSADNGNNTNWFFNTVWNVWLGTTSANFGTAGNWSPASVPDANAGVLVEVTNLLTIGSAATIRQLVVGGGGNVQVQANAPVTVVDSLIVRTNATLTINQPMPSLEISGCRTRIPH